MAKLEIDPSSVQTRVAKVRKIKTTIRAGAWNNHNSPRVRLHPF
jgi:hypothetical protein